MSATAWQTRRTMVSLSIVDSLHHHDVLSMTHRVRLGMRRIHEVASTALLKAVRAELHHRFALWLEERVAELVELDEIVEYHLEQAATYKQELGQVDDELAIPGREGLTGAGTYPPAAYPAGRLSRT